MNISSASPDNYVNQEGDTVEAKRTKNTRTRVSLLLSAAFLASLAACDSSCVEHNVVAADQTDVQEAETKVNLLEKYQQEPSQKEINEVLNDFRFRWVTIDGQYWTDSFEWNQNTSTPSKIVMLKKLLTLRDQRFSEPLPFTGGKSIYDYLKEHVDEIHLHLSDWANRGKDGYILMNRSMNSWAEVYRTDEGKIVPGYISALGLLVHESSHNDPTTPLHVKCPDLKSWRGRDYKAYTDASLEDNGAFAKHLIYLMWIYKYSLNDPPIMKEVAKLKANHVMAAFCNKPSHSNPKIQAIIDEILAESEEEMNARYKELRQ